MCRNALRCATKACCCYFSLSLILCNAFEFLQPDHIQGIDFESRGYVSLENHLRIESATFSENCLITRSRISGNSYLLVVFDPFILHTFQLSASMHYSLISLLVGVISIPAVLADRGSAPRITPTVCNSEPAVVPSDSTAAPASPTPTCFHAADPDGARGLCPGLANNGWCDCGSDGDYPNLTGSDVCGYTSLDPSATIVLSTTNCDASSTVQVLTVTVSPIPATSAPVAKRAEPHLGGSTLRRRASRLNRRQGQVSYADSCNAAPPPGSAYNADNGFPTMKSVLEQAYTDAVTLANQAQNVASDNKGFTHYFGGNLADKQLTHFQNMMKGVAGSENTYAIQFECANTPDCSDSSVFVTDATAGSATTVKEIQVCRQFWTSVSTRYLLYDSSKTTPNPPYRNNDATLQGWCRKSAANGDANVSARINQYFATAGHSVLHELTHVDSLAQSAGLDGDDSAGGAHGTDDFQSGCELAGARGFLSDYIAGNTGGTSPDYNAEGYAAAATEIYFMNLCGFSEIRPVVTTSG